MAKLIVNNLRLFNVDKFIETFDGSNIYYAFIGIPQTFNDDNNPPLLYDNVRDTFTDPHNNMIYGKRLTSSDVSRMIRRVDWTSNTVYAKYAHDDDSLFEKDFFVVATEASEYHVFKCLDNNGGAPSTDKPQLSETSASDEIYITPGDNYQWKYMYSINSAQFTKFSTNNHIPYIENVNVASNAVPGSIDNIEILFKGSNYIAVTNGFFQAVVVDGEPTIFLIDPVTASANNDHYNGSAIKITQGAGSGQQRKIVDYIVDGTDRKIVVDNAFEISPTTTSYYEITPIVNISGDGSGAVARALVNSTSKTIDRVEIVERGIGYTRATANVQGNTGLTALANLASVTATAKVILSPPGGHGSNSASELYARYIGISTTFDSSLSAGKVVDENDFRQIGILKDPKYANVQITISDASGIFQPGELITQSTSNAYGIVTFANASVVRLTNAYGIFVDNTSVNYILTSNGDSACTAIAGPVVFPNSYFDQTTTLVGSVISGSFTEDSLATQTNANGFVYYSNSTHLKLYNTKGIFTTSLVTSGANSEMNVTSFVIPDLIKSSGEVMYVENFSPIARATGQKETFKIIIEF